MTVIAVLSLKGGVGKTTTALHLAACAHAKKRSVTVIDADEERSAHRWASFRTLPYSVIPGERDRLAAQVRELEKTQKVVIIDTPPNNREVLMRAGMLATTVLVPVVPTGLDIDRMMPTLELLRDVEITKGSLDVAILLTRWDSRKRLAREAMAALGEYPVLEAKIRSLARYEEAFGTMPTYLDEYTAVWKELKA